MSRSINGKIAFLKECDKYNQAVDVYREKIQAQKMGHMNKVLASKNAYRKYIRTGDTSEIEKLKQLGVYVNTPL